MLDSPPLPYSTIALPKPLLSSPLCSAVSQIVFSFLCSLSVTLSIPRLCSAQSCFFRPSGNPYRAQIRVLKFSLKDKGNATLVQETRPIQSTSSRSSQLSTVCPFFPSFLLLPLYAATPFSPLGSLPLYEPPQQTTLLPISQTASQLPPPKQNKHVSSRRLTR
jgi:hypothetical protein